MTDFRALSFILYGQDKEPIFIELKSGETLEPLFLDWNNATKNIVSGIFFEIADQTVGAPEGQTQIVFTPWDNIAKITQVRPVVEIDTLGV